jgi:hypothetical protein
MRCAETKNTGGSQTGTRDKTKNTRFFKQGDGPPLAIACQHSNGQSEFGGEFGGEFGKFGEFGEFGEFGKFGEFGELRKWTRNRIIHAAEK